MQSNGHLPPLRPGPDCASFADLLPLLGVSALEEQEAVRVQTHLATCAYCQMQRATYDRIDLVLRRSFAASATLDISPEDLMTVSNQERPQKPPASDVPAPLQLERARHTRRLVSLVSAIAAVLVVAVIVAGIFASRGALPEGTGSPHPGGANTGSPSTPTAQETPYVPNPGGDILSAVQMRSSSDGWAVGGAYQSTGNGGVSSCLVLHYSNGQWVRVATPTNKELGFDYAEIQSIAMLSPDEGWAVGLGSDYASGSALAAGLSPYEQPPSMFTSPYSGPGGPLPGAFILHYSAGKWTRFSTIPDAELWSVQMLSPTDGWAAGGGGWGTDQGATTSILLHFNGRQWTPAQVPNVAGISSLDMLSSSDGWATGTNTVLHYDGKQWNIFQHLQGVSGLSMGSPTDGWAFGFVNFPDNHTSSYNEVWHYNGSQWAQGTLPSAINSNADILGLYMDSASDGWAVGFGNGDKGQNRYALYLHYTGGQWTQVQGPGTDNLNSVVMLSADEGWAVGNGGVLMHYQNGSWTRYHP